MEYDKVLTRLQRRAPAPVPLDKQSAFPFLTVDSPQTCPARFGFLQLLFLPGRVRLRRVAVRKIRFLF
ncbi:hypothetical protein LINPERHAP1_LOCUS34693 [Linum perenne]